MKFWGGFPRRALSPPPRSSLSLSHSGRRLPLTFPFALASPVPTPSRACSSQLPGIIYLEVDPCAHHNGGCSPHANCTKVAPGQWTCTCLDGYMGDGELCQGEAGIPNLGVCGTRGLVALLSVRLRRAEGHTRCGS